MAESKSNTKGKPKAKAKMMPTATTITRTLVEYTGTMANAAIVSVTAGLEQLTTLATYKCPCVNLDQLGNCTTSVGSGSCSQLLNFGYGVAFIIAPAIVLLVLGMASNPKLWKTVTGLSSKCESERREVKQIIKTILGIFGQALISPITWVCMAMLDERYYACAVTQLPFDVGPSASYKSCEKIALATKVYPSDSFNDNRSFSQLMGWILTSAFVVVGMTLFCICECRFPLTYYHANYYRLYRKAEEDEFKDEMKKQAKIDAEANVLKFMNKRRDKELWDRISTVFDFRRDKKKLALYSHLHEWVIDEGNNQEMQRLIPEKTNGYDHTPSSDNEDAPKEEV